MRRKKKYRNSRRKSQFRYIKMLVAVLTMTGVGFVVKGAMNGDVSSEVVEPKSVNAVKADEVEVDDDRELIVIDPGHGGIDPGSVVDGIYEKDVNLEVALKLQAALEEEGYSVMITRNDDESLSLLERTEFANEVGAELFISLHQNSYGEDTSVNGIEVYYNNREKSVESEEIAQLIQDGLITETGAKDRGIRAYNELVVTRETTMPSCLIEMGYMSNPTELALMNSDSYQDKMVTGIVNGINQFFEY